MKAAFIAFALLCAHFVKAQSELFEPAPLKGKVQSYTIFEVDTINQAEREIIKVTFDSRGRLLSRIENNSYSTDERQEKTVFYRDSSITYECYCRNIETFISEFKIRDKAELAHSRGGATGDAPSKFVSIKRYDKKGRVILIKRYSEAGYQIAFSTFVYDKKDNVLSEEHYDFYDKLVRSQKNKYDGENCLIETTIFYKDSPELRITKYEFDKTGLIMTTRYFENEKLLSQSRREEMKTANGSEKVYTKEVNLQNQIQKRIVKDTAGNVIYSETFNSEGKPVSTTKNQYDQSGNLISRIQINEAGEPSMNTVYTYDRNNNWVEMYTESYVIVHVGKEKNKELRRKTYKMKIDFF